MSERGLSIVVGVGPGLGNALVERFADAGLAVAVRGSAGFAAFAVPKFGLRALAQSMARAVALGYAEPRRVRADALG